MYFVYNHRYDYMYYQVCLFVCIDTYLYLSEDIPDGVLETILLRGRD